MGLTAIIRPTATAALTGLLLLLAAPATAQTFPKLTGRVVDQADIIPPAEETALNAQLEQLETKTGHQLVVATINDLAGNDIADYGYKLGREWKIGDEATDDGVVFLIAPNERRMNISVGLGLEPILTDALSGRIIRDTVTPLFKAGDMPGGIRAGVNAIAEQIQLPPEEAAARAAASQERDRADDGNFGGLFFVGFIIFFFFVLPMLSSLGRRGKRRKHSPWGAPIIIWGGDDWGGGSGGGSSWGGGGGGWGGGGGFSGGGGSFGGGGASGGW